MILTIISKQAAFRRVIWSEVEREVNPGIFLANSTIFMIPFDESSVTLSHNIDFSFFWFCCEKKNEIKIIIYHSISCRNVLPYISTTLRVCNTHESIYCARLFCTYFWQLFLGKFDRLALSLPYLSGTYWVFFCCLVIFYVTTCVMTWHGR